MSTPPMDEGPSDELLEAYRRASIDDPSQPSRHVREAILAQAERSVSADKAVPALIPRDQVARAANDAQWQWQWKAVAGIAVVGLVGLLVARSFRGVPQGAAPGTAAIAPAAQAPAATVPGGELQSAGPSSKVLGVKAGTRREGVTQGLAAEPEQSRATQPGIADADLSGMTAGEPRAPDLVAASVPVGRLSQTETGRSSAVAEASSASRGTVPSERSLATVRRAVRARYADLFKPAGSDTLNLVTVYMNVHGGIDRARVEEVPGGAVDAATLVVPDRFVALGLKRDEMGSIGFDRLVEPNDAQDRAGAVLLVLYAWPRRPSEPMP